MDNKLKELRQLKNLEQTEVARLMGCSKSYYCNLEKGKRIPSLKLAFDLAKFYNTPVEELFQPPRKNSSSEN